MPQVQVLPNFAEVVRVSSNADDKTISLIFRAEDNQNFAITLPAAVSPRLVQILLEKTPISDIDPLSFASRLSSLKTAIDQDGNPLLGLFFPSAIPVTIHLTAETISLLKFALTDLETKMGSGKDAQH